jgi:hypothetical protein
MKTIKVFLLASVCACFAITASAQKTKTETFNVSGNCGMCEAKIEKAAKSAGASYAEWNKDTKIITVKFSSSTSNLAKIQKSIADAGYDNVGAKAMDDSYNKLHACCKYDRTSNTTATMDCCKDGKCTMEGHDGKDCCKKDGKCTMAGHDGKDCCKKEGAAKMDCCKDGKCTKEGHDGKDCCKKEH